MMKYLAISALALAVACGQPASTVTEAQAQPTTTATEVGATDRAALLRALNLAANARGQVANACDERVTPQYFAVDMGGPVGASVLVLIPGGPNTATCYGDVPGAFFLMKRNSGGFTQIFAAQGYFVIMPSAHQGAHDVSVGGPGFEFPLYVWNGHEYAATSRSISDTQLATGQSFP